MKATFLTGKEELCLYLLLSFSIGVYLVLRAIYIPLVHDEAATFFHFINSGIITPYKAIPDAANHLLNNYLCRIFYLLFGNSELVIRLANLMFFPVFVFFLWQIAQRLKTSQLRWGFIFSILCSHYFVEHFSYSRGYAMSIALLLAAIHYFLQFTQTQKTKYLLFCLLSTALMIFANLGTMNTGLMFVVISLLLVVWQKKSLGLRLALFIPLILLIVYLANFSLWLGSIGSLYYGGDSFLTYTIQTIWPLWVGSGSLISYSLLVVLVLFTIAMLLFAIKSQSKTLFSVTSLAKPAHLFLILFAGNIAGVFLLYWLFNVNFPEDRVAMHFLPLLLGAVFFYVEQLPKQILKPVRYVLFSLALLLPINFLFSANLTHSTFWIYERIAPTHYEAVKGKTDEKGYPTTVNARLIKRLGWAYEIFSQNLEINQVSSKDFPGTVHDYIMLHEWQKPTADLLKYKLINTDPVNNLHLYERKTKLKRKSITKKKLIEKNNITDEFIDFYKDSIQHLVGKSLLAGLEFEAQLANQPTTNFRIVLAVEDSEGNTLNYIPFICHWHRKDWSELQQFSFSLVLDEVPENAATLKCYLWNMRKAEFATVKCEMRLYELVEQ